MPNPEYYKPRRKPPSAAEEDEEDYPTPRRSSTSSNGPATRRGGGGGSAFPTSSADDGDDFVPLVYGGKKLPPNQHEQRSSSQPTTAAAGAHRPKTPESGMVTALELETEDYNYDDSEGYGFDDDDDDDDGGHHGTGPPGSANTVQMIINIVISFVGAGLLGQPHAFLESGWLLGGIALLTVSALNVYAMLRLPAVQQELLKHRAVSSTSATSLASYSDIGRAVLGPKGESLVIACLGISQAGFATAYIIFIAANLKSIARIPRIWVCGACIPGLIGLVQFRDLKSLSPFSLLANVANFCALSAVLFQDYESYEPHNDTIEAVRWGGLLYVVAVTIYSMEGVGLILSLKASYKHPQQFGRVLMLTIAMISTFMAVFGAAGYWAFGNDTKAPVTLNLTSAWSATFVKLALCLGLYLTYPIMMFPIWNIMEASHPTLQTNSRQRFLVRGGMVILSATVAFAMPNFGKFLSLVGSSICTLLGFVFPAYFHLRVCGKDLPKWQYGLDVVILCCGLLFGVLGTLESVTAMIRGESME